MLRSEDAGPRHQNLYKPWAAHADAGIVKKRRSGAVFSTAGATTAAGSSAGGWRCARRASTASDVNVGAACAGGTTALYGATLAVESGAVDCALVGNCFRDR
jgi:hypothetical protein